MTKLQTEYEGQVKKYMEVLENTDAVIAARGDGTLLEVNWPTDLHEHIEISFLFLSLR